LFGNFKSIHEQSVTMVRAEDVCNMDAY
jgi:hypothetical protein